MNKSNKKKDSINKLKIKEIIVVEGKDDVSAVKAAVDAEIITTSGLGITNKKLEQIRKASEKRGIIVLTDPDFPGKKIRYWVSENLTNVKHAYISKSNALKNGNVGVENARPEVIIEALKSARAILTDEKEEFTKKDMVEYGLTGYPNSSERRQVLGQLLNIGHCSGKQFLKRLNNYGVTRREFEDAIDKVIEDDE
jgi:ribonuclease M5